MVNIIISRSQGKFDCLVYETLLIKELRPSLNTESDYVSAKLFVMLLFLIHGLLFFVHIDHSYRIFFKKLDNDVRERRNVVYFLTF